MTSIDSNLERAEVRRLPKAALTVWVLLAVTIGLMFTYVLVRRSMAATDLGDFVQEWTSCRNFFAGDPVYAPLDESMSKHFGRPIQVGVIRHNAHPPASVLVSLPFCKFSYPQSLRIWNTVSWIALAVSLALLFSRQSLAWSPAYAVPIFALLMSSNPLAQQVLQGQLNLLLLLLLTGFWLAARQKRWLQAGLWVGIAGAIKLFPLYLGLYFLGRRKGIAVIGVGLGFFGLNAITVAMFGVESYQTFFGEVAPSVAKEFQEYWPNASIGGFFRKTLDGSVGHVKPLASLPTLATTLTLAAAVIVTVVVGRQCWLADNDDQKDRAIASCVLAMLLVSPITWDHYFVMLIPFLSILWAQSPRRVNWEHALMLGLLVVLFTIRPTWIWDRVIPGDGELAMFRGDSNAVPSVGETWHVLTVLSYQFYGLMILLAYSVWKRPAGRVEATTSPTAAVPVDETG